jgi:3-hydroxyisobutyrate dehydrogenase-like beta-hydroxyacid dehydrogenase
MKTVGIIGIGDMGIGMSKNLIKRGFNVQGYDVSPSRLEKFKELGGKPCKSCADVATNADAVFIMVLSPEQAESAIFGEHGLAEKINAKTVVILTATIGRTTVENIAKRLLEKGVKMIDSGVSGGQFGADAGTLTMMASGEKTVFDSCQDIMQSVGQKIFYVGEKPGTGQVVKACLQAMGAIVYAATFETLILGAVAGVDIPTLVEVVSSSVCGTPSFTNAAEKIMDREFVGTGSHVRTMYKDVGITMAMAKDLGVPLPTTSIANQIFQAIITKYPEEDNWAGIKLYEEIVGVKVKR